MNDEELRAEVVRLRADNEALRAALDAMKQRVETADAERDAALDAVAALAASSRPSTPEGES